MTITSRVADTASLAVLPSKPNPALFVLLAFCVSFSLSEAQAQTRVAAPEAAAPPPGCPIGWKPVPPGLNPALRCLPDNFTATVTPGQAAPPQGCPSAWNRVAPGVNPVLRCQPGSVVIKDTSDTAAPLPGCPSGWKPAPPGVNPVLRCVPANLVLTPRPGSAAPPPGCPQGWKPVKPSVNPVMGCLPGQLMVASGPQADRDQGGPIQFQAAQLAPADLALIGSFRLGDKQIPWGTEATVSAAAASFKKMGRCGFRYLYRTRNEGQVASGATVNRVLRDTQDGPVLATKPLPALAPGKVGTSDGHLSLAPGTWMLYVHADASQSVVESDETNNLRRVRLTVDGDCS